MPGFIYAGNWAEAVIEGWRHVHNTGDAARDKAVTEQLIRELGSAGVMLGTPFVNRSPGGLRLLGIYARDVDVEVMALYEDIMNFECGHPIRT